MQAFPGILQLSRHEVSDAKDDVFHGHGPPRPGGVLVVRDVQQAGGRALPGRIDRSGLSIWRGPLPPGAH
eukprot:4592773-Lingulodinium_polyedra.AAC.1